MKKLCLFVLLFLVTAAKANAALEVKISEGTTNPIPIAIPEFVGSNSASQKVATDIANLVAADLERSGLFKIVPRDQFIQPTNKADFTPSFPDWRVINADALVGGQVNVDGGKMKTEFRLWDTATEQQIAGLSYSTGAETWRRVAHKIADSIYQRITGESGYFDTRVIFVAETGDYRKRKKRLAVMDQDGANLRYITDGSFMVLTPRFSPTAQQITYLAYFGDTPKVYMLDLNTGAQKMLGTFSGMTFAPRFSPDGQSVIMSMAKDGNTDIFTMSLKSGATKQLTDDAAIDTSPSFSPDAEKVVFNSDRGGSQQLYVMDRDGGNVKRISFGDGRYGTPAWSPRGDLIAFTKMAGGKFFIGVMRPDGSGERLLTESFLDEGPTWSPNGRVIMFSREVPTKESQDGKVSRIMSVDLTGENLREIVTPTDASDPAWSPLIP